MKSLLLSSQRGEGELTGSWDPVLDEQEKPIGMGRQGVTAMSALCLAVYYRYLPLYR
jgi:hypothetical protein